MTQTRRAWVGESVLRVEDEALLRGQGRFMDDLEPVPHARHAAIVRSPFAHARIGSIDVSAALELPGVLGVLTGEDVLGALAAVPRRHRDGRALLRARDRRRALRRRARRGRRRRLALRRRGRGRARRWSTTTRSTRRSVDGRTSARSPTARSTRRSRPPTSSSRGRYAFPRWTGAPVECYGVVADWRGDGAHRLGELPGAVHAALGRRRGARAARLEAAADHAAGLRRLVRDQVVRSSSTSC